MQNPEQAQASQNNAERIKEKNQKKKGAEKIVERLKKDPEKTAEGKTAPMNKEFAYLKRVLGKLPKKCEYIAVNTRKKVLEKTKRLREESQAYPLIRELESLRGELAA